MAATDTGRDAFLLAQRHRNRQGCLLSVTGQKGQLVNAGQEPIAESCAHRRCQRRRHPKLRTEFCLESRSNSIPAVKPQSFSSRRDQNPEASPVHWLWTFTVLGATCSQVGMLVHFWAVCGVRSCRLLLKQAFAHLRSFDMQTARSSMAEKHAEG